MKRLILLIAATALTASPAAAQMKMPGMNMPGMKMPPPKKKAATAHRPAAKKANSPAKKVTPPKRSNAAKKATANKPAMHDHKGMSTPGMEMQSTSKPHAGGTQQPSRKTTENMPGMNMPPRQSMPPMSGMNMPSTEPPVGPPPAAALKGPENAADTVYGTAAMQPSRTFLMRKEHGGMTASRLLINQMETRVRHGGDGYFVNAQAWHGGDTDKLWLKSEVEGDYGRKPHQAELQALWSHALDPWFNLQTGVRFDTEPRTRGRLVLGVEGLAPYWWEVDAAAFISTKGDITARVEASHDVRITQKLILQPRAQLDFALQDIASERVGSGLSKAEIGCRLRYQFVPNFAPYVGVVYERAVGQTARFVRADGENPGGIQFTVGVRTWF